MNISMCFLLFLPILLHADEWTYIDNPNAKPISFPTVTNASTHFNESTTEMVATSKTNGSHFNESTTKASVTTTQVPMTTTSKRNGDAFHSIKVGRTSFMVRIRRPKCNCSHHQTVTSTPAPESVTKRLPKTVSSSMSVSERNKLITLFFLSQAFVILLLGILIIYFLIIRLFPECYCMRQRSNV